MITSRRSRLFFTSAMAGIAVAAVIAQHEILLSGSLSGYDWALNSRYYDWIRTSLTSYGTLPLYMENALHSPNLLANPEAPILGPLVGLLAILPTGAYIKLLLVLYTTAGLLGMYALLRDLNVERTIAAVLAVVFAFDGFFAAHLGVGHHMVLGFCLLPLIVLCVRRASNGSRRALWCATALNVCTLFEGQEHPFIWNNVFVALCVLTWSIEQRRLAPIKVWVAFLAASVGLGAVKLLPMLAEFGAYAPATRFSGLPPGAALWTLIAPGQTAQTRWPGVRGIGWWEYNHYIGCPAFLLLVGGLAAGVRRAWTWIVVGAFFLLISLDLTPWLGTLDPWSLIKHLPVWQSQRCPSRFLSVALPAFLVAAGIGLQSVWERSPTRVVYPRLMQAAVGIVLVWVYADLYSEARPWKRLALGSPRPPAAYTFGGLRGEEGGAKLREFRPNRLVYELEAGHPVRLVLPIPDPLQRLEWHPVGLAADARDGVLAVSVPPGTQEIVVKYTPRFLHLGVLLSATMLVGAITSEIIRARTRRSTSTLPPQPVS